MQLLAAHFQVSDDSSGFLLGAMSDQQARRPGTLLTAAGVHVAVATSPPLDLVGNGLRLVLTTDDGFVLADLSAPAGSKWSANAAGTAWKYRDPLASTGIFNARVRAISPGTLRVQVKARGLALGGAAAAAPPVARIAFAEPTGAPARTVRGNRFRSLPGGGERCDAALSLKPTPRARAAP